jgi:hypothetical protein
MWLPSLPLNQLEVIVIEENTRSRSGGGPRIAAVRRRVIHQELNRHGPHRKTVNTIDSLTAIKLLYADREGKGAASWSAHLVSAI